MRAHSRHYWAPPKWSVYEIEEAQRKYDGLMVELQARLSHRRRYSTWTPRSDC